MADHDRLLALAGEHGIEPGYHDIWGNWHHTSPDALRAVLRSMGCAAGNAGEVEASLQAAHRERQRQVLHPVIVRPVEYRHGWGPGLALVGRETARDTPALRQLFVRQ